jgi:peroxiredoxin
MQIRANCPARHALFTTLLLAMVLVTALGCSNNDEVALPTSPEDIGLQEVEVAAPDFTLPTLDGGDVTLSDLQGQIVLLNFWQLDCPPCKDEMPLLDAAAKAQKGTLHVVALDLGDSPSSMQQYFGDADLNMLVPYDREGRVAATYSVGYTPTTFLIDSQGVVRYVKVGSFASYAEVAAAIEFTRIKESE